MLGIKCFGRASQAFMFVLLKSYGSIGLSLKLFSVGFDGALHQQNLIEICKPLKNDYNCLWLILDLKDAKHLGTPGRSLRDTGEFEQARLAKAFRNVTCFLVQERNNTLLTL